MPEQTEVEPKPTEADSGTESETDDIPDLEPTGSGSLHADISKAKQSRGEKKARKLMSKLGLKPVSSSLIYIQHTRDICLSITVCLFYERYKIKVFHLWTNGQKLWDDDEVVRDFRFLGGVVKTMHASLPRLRSCCFCVRLIFDIGFS